MMNALARKLQNYVRLSPEEVLGLERVVSERAVSLGPRKEIVSEGEAPRYMHVVLHGWACRYKELLNGRRQITGFCLPGDLCDERIFVLKRMDHSLATVTSAIIGRVGQADIGELLAAHPRLQRAVWWQTQVLAAVQREWTVSLGQRSAVERMAHLLCEIHHRLRMVGLAAEDGCELPLTQAELGEATGLSTVHVNRTLQELRNAGLIVLQGRSLTIPDLEALREAAMFNESYLHADLEGAHLHANG